MFKHIIRLNKHRIVQTFVQTYNYNGINQEGEGWEHKMRDSDYLFISKWREIEIFRKFCILKVFLAAA